MIKQNIRSKSRKKSSIEYFKCWNLYGEEKNMMFQKNIFKLSTSVDSSMGNPPQKHKDLRKCFHVSRLVQLFSLIILVKKYLHLHQQMTVLGSKYCETWNSFWYLTFFSILTLPLSFLDESKKFFLPKWSARRALQTGLCQKILEFFFFFVVDYSCVESRPP